MLGRYYQMGLSYTTRSSRLDTAAQLYFVLVLALAECDHERQQDSGPLHRVVYTVPRHYSWLSDLKSD